MKEYIVQAFAQETIEAFDSHNAPELVRCKDCIWYDQRDGICEHHAVINNPSQDWFCADGERRET